MSLLPQETLSELSERAQTCTACALSQTRTKVVFGSGSPTASLVVLGEGPGAKEDEQGLPFIGRSGNLLQELLLEELGLARDEIYITNMVKCRPPENRNPAPEELDACRPFLLGQLKALNPVVIVTLGNFATKTLLDTKHGITTLRGKTYPSTLCDAPVVPTFHPAAALRGGRDKIVAMREDLFLVKGLLEKAGQ